jgi:hypothetical protein
MIIIEGMDNSGKTRLSNRISGGTDRIETPTEYQFLPLVSTVHSPSSLPWAAKAKWCEQAIKLDRQGYLIVYDRFPLISEKVYGPILRGKDESDTPASQVLWNNLFEQPQLIIYCRPPDEFISKTWYERDQLAGTSDSFWQLLNSYDAYMTRLGKETDNLILTRYDYTKNVDNSLLALVRRYVCDFIERNNVKSPFQVS